MNRNLTYIFQTGRTFSNDNQILKEIFEGFLNSLHVLFCFPLIQFFHFDHPLLPGTLGTCDQEHTSSTSWIFCEIMDKTLQQCYVDVIFPAWNTRALNYITTFGHLCLRGPGIGKRWIVSKLCSLNIRAYIRMPSSTLWFLPKGGKGPLNT